MAAQNGDPERRAAWLVSIRAQLDPVPLDDDRMLAQLDLVPLNTESRSLPAALLTVPGHSSGSIQGDKI